MKVRAAVCDDGTTIAVEVDPRDAATIEEAFRKRRARECLTREFDAFVRERQECAADDECIRVDTWCPFSPGASVAERHGQAVRNKYEEVAAQYAELSSCKYKASPLGATVCRDGRCAFAEQALSPRSVGRKRSEADAR